MTRRDQPILCIRNDMKKTVVKDTVYNNHPSETTQPPNNTPTPLNWASLVDLTLQIRGCARSSDEGVCEER